MAISSVTINETLEHQWQPALADSKEQLPRFLNFCKEYEERFNKEQKAIAALTEAMLLHVANRHTEAEEIIAVNKNRFNRIDEPIYAHRWKRMQLVEDFRQGKTNEAYEAAKQLAEEAKNEAWLPEHLRALYLVHMAEATLGFFKLAIATATQIKLIATENKMSFHITEAAWTIAHTYHQFGHHAQALQECEKIKPLFGKDLSQPLHLHYYLLLAVCEQQNGQAGKAIAIYQNILAYLKQNKINDSGMVITAVSNLAEALLQKGKYAEAEAQFIEMKSLAVKANWLLYQVDANMHLCELYHRWKKFAPMLSSIKAAEKLLKQMQLPEYEIKLLRFKSQYEQASGNTGKALEYFQNYHQRFEEWKTIDDAEKLKALELKHELQIEQLKREMMKKENQIQQQELQMLNSFLDQRDKLIHEFATQYKELEATSLQRKAVFARLNEMVHNVEFTAKEERESYSAKFNDVHQASVNKLQKHYPALSNTEAKVAVMLTQGLSNKEISSLTLTTVRNIETARTRMRKKMKLKREDDLLKKIREAIG